MTWREGSAFDGRLITNQLIADGDAACSAGQAVGASQLYDRALRAPLGYSDARELAVRRASLALSRGSAADALQILELFSKRASLPENASQSVKPDFAFLLGSAFAGTGDIEQALAWWSKVYLAQHGSGPLALRSKDATFQLLRRVDDESLERTQQAWLDDDMVRTALAQARANRLSVNEMASRLESSRLESGRIKSGSESAQSTASQHNSGTLKAANLGLLLPLTGRFQALGERAKRGVEVALSTQASPLALITVDSGESASLVHQKISELAAAGVEAIIGPLLAEQVEDVVTSAPAGTVILSLSKRSAGVTDGTYGANGSFLTLGITAESQVDSILDHARHVLGITQIAVIGSNEGMQTFGELVRMGMRTRALSLVLERSFAKEDIAAATSIGRDIGASKAQAVLFLDNAGIAGSIAAGIPESDRQNIKLLGLAAWDNEAQLQQSRTVLESARFVTGFPRTSQRLAIKNFIATYQQRYREMPDVVAAQGFDAASLLLAARERQTSAGGLTQSFQNLPTYEGLTGRIENTPTGIVRRLAVLEFRNGQVTEIQ